MNQGCVCTVWPHIRAFTGLEPLIDCLSSPTSCSQSQSEWLIPSRGPGDGRPGPFHRAWGLPEGDLEGLQGEGNQFPGPPNPGLGAHFLGSLHSRVDEWMAHIHYRRKLRLVLLLLHHYDHYIEMQAPISLALWSVCFYKVKRFKGSSECVFRQ